MDRRDFIKATAATVTATAAVPMAAAAQPAAADRDSATGMRYRTLGRTGERVSMVGVGGFHLSKPKDPAEATRIVHAAIDAGITFFDNC